MTTQDRNSPDTDTVRMNEIYASIQGESTWAGMPCVFVRLARCNLRCRWCDTVYSFKGGENRAIGEVVTEACAYEIPLIEITGGEPLVQRSCPALCQAFLDRGHTVLIETSGSLPIDRLPPEVIKIMDLKCPDSGEVKSNYWPNIDALNPDQDEVKFVIASREDYEWSREVVTRYTLEKRCHSILFSPVFGAVEPADMVAWILEDKLPVRFQLQMHKFIWAPAARGV